MTVAVAGSTPTQTPARHTVPIAIIGTDALLSALPATPVQLAHACLKAGFANVIPASWGDELIASAVLRRLPQYGTSPVIQCSCPIVAHRLLTVGADLRPVLLPLVPPPVAVARYIRAMSHQTGVRITYVGACPGAVDESIDIRMTPDALVALLAERQIAIDEQPTVFESIIPADRRRFRSQPGGVPTSDALWSELGSRTLAELGDDDLAAEVAQLLLTGKNVLIDPSTRLGCVCSGATAGMSPADARAHVVRHEPPRASTPIVDERAPIELDLHVPAASRTPVDVMAVPPADRPQHAVVQTVASEMPLGHRMSPVRGTSTMPDVRPPRASGPVNPRSVSGSVPVTRDVDGRALPRAYVARRRSSPRGVPVVASPNDGVSRTAAPTRQPRPSISRPPEPSDSSADGIPTAPRVVVWPVPSRQLLYALAAIVALATLVSTAVVLVAERSLAAPPAAAPPPR